MARDHARGVVIALFFVAISTLIPHPAWAQASGTLPPLDPAYRDLAFLEAHSLTPRGLSSLRPLSYGRVAWLVRDARLWLAANPREAGTVHSDLEAVLARLERRFSVEALARSEFTAELEAGGGRSPGRRLADNGIGSADMVLNPLWANRGGRAYGDEATGAAGGRATMRVASSMAIGVAGRLSALRASGVEPGRRGGALEAAYLRARVGRFAVQLGRDTWWQTAQTLGTSLSFSGNAPPVDLVRVGTDHPLSVFVLGDVELAATAADLGANQNFPHARLFVFSMKSRPIPDLRLGLTIVNKQGGEGAPEASTADRVKDLSFVWDLFTEGTSFPFSDKMTGVQFHLTLPAFHRAELFGEVNLTDFDHRRVRTMMSTAAGYRMGFALRRLGDSGRHGLVAEGEWLGALMYRHEQFLSGMTVDGFAQGSNLGPDGRRLSLAYDYYAPTAAWGAKVRATYEARSIDRHERDRTTLPPIFRRAEAFPSEHRYRLHARVQRWLGDRSGLALSGGVERVSDFEHQSGAERTNFALLLHLWQTF